LHQALAASIVDLGLKALEILPAGDLHGTA
jgi:hypothetical protein